MLFRSRGSRISYLPALHDAESPEARLYGPPDFSAFFPVDGASGDEYEIKTVPDIFTRKTDALLHEAPRSVSCDAVAYFFACQKSCAVYRSSVFTTEYNDVFIADRPALLVERVKIGLSSQYIRPEHVLLLRGESLSALRSSSLEHVPSVLGLHSLSEAMLFHSLPVLRLKCHFDIVFPPKCKNLRCCLNFNSTYKVILLSNYITVNTGFYRLKPLESFDNFIHTLWITLLIIVFSIINFPSCLLTTY